jgi:16S rRNA processing protein RimM
MSEGRIALGVIRKPHGVRGEASIEAWTGTPERFEELDRVFLVSPDERDAREAPVESVRIHGGRPLVKFGGIDSPEEVRDLRNWTIEIPESEARPPEEGEYFLHDLVGLRLVDAAGNEQGDVVDAYETGGGVLLDVQRGGKRFSVPFAAAICTRIDLPSKTITVDLPEGIDEI